jgi:hypothetical protein
VSGYPFVSSMVAASCGRIAMRPYVTLAAGFVPLYPPYNGALYAWGMQRGGAPVRINIIGDWLTSQNWIPAFAGMTEENALCPPHGLDESGPYAVFRVRVTLS